MLTLSKLRPVFMAFLGMFSVQPSVTELCPGSFPSFQAAEFRQFWGSRSELRRFQDGAIREAVVWEAESLSEKRLIPHQVVTHLLAL